MIFESAKDGIYIATLGNFHAIIAIRFSQHAEGHLYLIPFIEDIQTWGSWVYPHDSLAARHATLVDIVGELITHIPMILLVQGMTIQDTYDTSVRLFEGLAEEPDRLRSIMHTSDQQGVCLYDFITHRMTMFYREAKLKNTSAIFIGYHIEYGIRQRIVEVTAADGTVTWIPSVNDIVLPAYTEKPSIEEDL